MENLREFRYPQTLSEALEQLADDSVVSRVIAGGTSVSLSKNAKVEVLIDISRIGLDRLSHDGNTVRIGAGVTALQLAEDPDLPRFGFGALTQAAATAGPAGVRAAMTVGGNVVQCFAWSDLPVALLVFDTKVHVAARKNGTKHQDEIALPSLLKRHPTKQLAANHLVTDFTVTMPGKGFGSAFVKFSRTTTDYGLVTTAAAVRVEGAKTADDWSQGRITNLAIAVGAIRPLPFAVSGLETFYGEPAAKLSDDSWLDAVGAHVCKDALPIADMRATPDYRRKVLGALVGRAVRQAGEHARQRI